MGLGRADVVKLVVIVLFFPQRKGIRGAGGRDILDADCYGGGDVGLESLQV